MTVVCWDLAMMWSFHFFLPVLCGLVLGSISRKELLPFHFLFPRLSFLPLLKCACRWWTQWPPLCERARDPVFILTALLVGDDHSSCERSGGRGLWALHGSGARVLQQQSIARSHSHLYLAWTQVAHKSHLHLWQETFLSQPGCSCLPDKGHRICLQGQMGQAEAPQSHGDCCTAWE